MGSITDLYEEAITLYNAGDIDGYANFYAEDAVITLPNGTFQGRTAIREEWDRLKGRFPDQTLMLDATFEQGDTFADEFTWVATNTGPLVLRDGTELPPTGKRVEIKGMELVQVRNEKIAVHHVYFDRLALRRALEPSGTGVEAGWT